MAQKITYEYVKERFEAEGYRLLSKEYVNNRTKLEYECPNGHRWKIAWSKFISGRRCPECAKSSRSEKQKLSFEEVFKGFKDDGYELLETSYVNNSKKMRCTCPEGHIWDVTWRDFNSGRRCPKCSRKIVSEKQRLDPAIVFEEFSRNGYRLLEDTYVNAHTKMGCLCPSGHYWETDWNSFHSGVRCLKCYNNSQKLDYSYVIETIESEGYKVLSKYEHSLTKMECICPNGHTWWVTWNKFKLGRRCPKCHWESMVNYDVVKDYFLKYGYELVSTGYDHAHAKLECLCPNEHIWEVTWSNFKKGCRCPKCLYMSNISKPEAAIYDYVKSLGFDAESSCRRLLNPKEVDIFIPEKRLAIEYCGLYWHSENGAGKSRAYHREKLDGCFVRGVRLITVFEDEYLEKPDIVKSRIANALGVSSKRMYARNCVISKVDRDIEKEFFKEYHLQGYAPSTICFGLLHNEKLVALASLGQPARPHARKDGRIELKRFCTRPGYSIVGGMSKLFSSIVKYCKHAGFSTIISYCDMRWANPFKPVYELLGFKLERETKYTPHYVDKNYMKRWRNQSLALKPIERKLGKSEAKLRQEQGYDRIWDCGHRTYIFNVS